MQTTIKRSPWLVTGLIALVATSSTQAATYCVRNATELQQALSAAAASPGNDEVNIQEGIYTVFTTPFSYTAQNPGWLGISGGWYNIGGNDCAQRRTDASRTVLDGAGQHQVLRINYLPPAGTTQFTRLVVFNLTLANGYGDPAVFQRGGGLQMASYSDGYTELWAEHLIVSNNEGYFAGGADFSAKNGMVRVVNSLYANNRAPTTANGHFSITVNSTIAAHAVVVANSTFIGGRCAGQGPRGCGIHAGLGGGVHMDIVNSLFVDNDISDVNIEGGAVIGIGDGSASADSSLIGIVHGNLPLVATHPLSGDPRFVDPANSDWRLRDDSPFINQAVGAIFDYPVSAFDLSGSPRVRFSAQDPGPYENQTWDFIFRDSFD